MNYTQQQRYDLYNNNGWSRDEVRRLIRDCDQLEAERNRLLAECVADKKTQNINFVDQTIYGWGGNCYPACLSSVTGIPLEEIPNYEFKENSVELWESWFNKVGLWSLKFKIKPETPPSFILPMPHDINVIASGKSRAGNFHHAVVGKLILSKDGWTVKVIHDPHPSRDALVEINTVEFIFEKLKPMKKG